MTGYLDLKKIFSSFSVVSMSLILSGCGYNIGNAESVKEVSDNAATEASTAYEEAADNEKMIQITDSDMDTGYDEENSTIVKMESNEIDISGNGAKVEDGKIVIDKEGTYIFRGEFNNRGIYVDAEYEDDIRIVFDNADFICDNGKSNIDIEKGNVRITLAEGSQNRIEHSMKAVSGNSAYNYVSDMQKAAIFSKQDLTFNGNGRLEIKSGTGSAIGCSTNIIIVGGKYLIESDKPEILADGMVRMINSDYVISSGR